MLDELVQKLDGVLRKLKNSGKLTESNIAESMREIRRVLLEADVNYRVVKEFVQQVHDQAVGTEVLRSISPGQQVVKIVHDELVKLLGQANAPLVLTHLPPTVIMIVGLQGSGKTTFTGKLGVLLRKQNRSPLLVAADVYRPAAIEQLQALGKSANLPVFSEGTISPVDIAQHAFKKARQDGRDILLIDTAGRLHIDQEMMDELGRIKSALNPAEILFVADGMTGQDAVKSAQAFLEALDFTGIVLTKMDGDARGGAALSIRSITGKPIKFIGTGETLSGIEPFYPDRMASRILGMGDVVSLVEKAQEAIDQEEAAKLAHKFEKESFNLEDFYAQLQQMKKMGPLDQILGMLPNMGGKIKNLQVDESAMTKTEAIINSMTIQERRKPNIINGSRRKRIANGSGTSVQDINQLLRQFQSMQKMMKQMKNMGKRGKFRGLPLGF